MTRIVFLSILFIIPIYCSDEYQAKLGECQDTRIFYMPATLERLAQAIDMCKITMNCFENLRKIGTIDENQREDGLIEEYQSTCESWDNMHAKWTTYCKYNQCLATIEQDVMKMKNDSQRTNAGEECELTQNQIGIVGRLMKRKCGFSAYQGFKKFDDGVKTMLCKPMNLNTRLCGIN